MTSIAERQMTVLQVYQSYEEGDKHTTLIVLTRQCIVHLCADLGRLQPLVGQRLEHPCGLCHEQGGRHTLATDIAQTEIQQVVVYHIAIKVATREANTILIVNLIKIFRRIKGL